MASENYDRDFKFLSSLDIGELGLVDNSGYPRIIPLNFIEIDKDIYFHGSLDGEKYQLIKKSPKATFSVYKSYSFIPSYFTSKKYACPATHFFKSMHIRGDASIISEISEKARVLQTMMEKYQGSNSHTAIGDISLYRNALENVGVYRIKAEEITIKIKFGQNESDRTMEMIVKGLRGRDEEIDRLTVDEILSLRKQN